MQHAYAGIDGLTGKARQAARGRGGKGHGRGNGSQKGAGGGSGGNNSEWRCHRCHRRGHFKSECQGKESDILEVCSTCSGFGHTSKQCPSSPTEQACLGMVLEEANLGLEWNEHDRAEELIKRDPGWEKLNEEEKEDKVQDILTSAF